MDYQLKAQPSLRGWSAWAVGELVRFKRQSVAEVTAKIIEDWLESRSEFLEKTYDISLKRFPGTAEKNPALQERADDK